MKRFVVFILALGALGGPFSAAASAGPVCTLQEKLGVENVKDCEDYLP